MDITNIFELVILLLSALVATFVIPLLKQKFGQEKLNKVMTYVEIAVHAADQLFATDEGKAKKEYVVNYLTEMLKKQGLTVDMETLENMIEAEVLKLHQQLKTE